jgi:hypothetical protein
MEKENAERLSWKKRFLWLLNRNKKRKKGKVVYGLGTTERPEILMASAALSGFTSKASGLSHHQNFWATSALKYGQRGQHFASNLRRYQSGGASSDGKLFWGHGFSFET